MIREVPDRRSDVEKALRQADRARAFWQEHRLDAYDEVLLLPDPDDPHQKNLLQKFESRVEALAAVQPGVRAIVLAVSEIRPGGRCEGKRISADLAEALLSLTCLYEFTERLVIGSFDLPYGRKLRNLLDRGVVSAEDLAEIAVT